MDPEAAQDLNPYQHIGKLAVGHIIFRLRGNEYQTVEIRSIEKTEEYIIDCVCNLELPGEHQTYHAYGYLVDTNTPSRILRQTIDMLRNVPGSKRLDLLSHCQEVWPMFQKFDVQCINQRLNLELFGKYHSPDGKNPIAKNVVSFEDRIKIGRTLSRPRGVPIDRLTRGFSLTPHHPNRLPAGYTLPTLSLVDGYLLVQGQAQIRSTCDPCKRCFRWTRELHQQGIFEHGVVEIHSEAISGTGVIYLSSESKAQKIPSKDLVYSFEADARSLEPLHAKQDTDDEWRRLGQWKVTLDQSVWPPNTDRTKPDTPMDGGILEDGYMKSPDGLKTSMVRLPLVEQLRDQINQRFGKELGSFYKACQTSKNNKETFTITFSRAPLVPFVSDAGLDIKKKFHVGFQSGLGIDVTLPMLFHQMTITFDAQDRGFTGYLFEYDPNKRGYKGDR